MLAKKLNGQKRTWKWTERDDRGTMPILFLFHPLAVVPPLFDKRSNELRLFCISTNGNDATFASVRSQPRKVDHVLFPNFASFILVNKEVHRGQILNFIPKLEIFTYNAPTSTIHLALWASRSPPCSGYSTYFNLLELWHAISKCWTMATLQLLYGLSCEMHVVQFFGGGQRWGNAATNGLICAFFAWPCSPSPLGEIAVDCRLTVYICCALLSYILWKLSCFQSSRDKILYYTIDHVSILILPFNPTFTFKLYRGKPACTRRQEYVFLSFLGDIDPIQMANWDH